MVGRGHPQACVPQLPEHVHEQALRVALAADDTVVVFDSHWFTTVEFVISAHGSGPGCSPPTNCRAGCAGSPRTGAATPELAHAAAALGDKHGTWITAIDDPCLPLHYGTVGRLCRDVIRRVDGMLP